MKNIVFTLTTGFIVIFIFLCRAEGQSGFRIVTAKGIVNTREIGGQGLHVFSMWNEGKTSWVSGEEQFSVNILSSERPQRLVVRDHARLSRGLALVGSQHFDRIVFDAQSTAFALLFGDPGQIKNNQDIDRYFEWVSEKKSYQNFVNFLKDSLSFNSIEELVRNDQYKDLFERCRLDVFGKDSQSIRKSLYQAQDQLEDLFSR